MAHEVLARFWQVSRKSEQDPVFSVSLENASHNPGWVMAFQNVHIRIDHFAQNGEFSSGDFVRRQTSNLPPLAPDVGPLQPQPNPIGHRTAFLHHRGLDLILLEANQQGASPTRISRYLKQATGCRGYDINPCLSRDALARLADGTPTKFLIRVAHPENMELADGPGRDFIRNLGNMREMFGGPVIEVSSGFGHRWHGQALNGPRIKAAIRQILPQRDQGVEKLIIKIDEEEDPIDLLKSQIKCKEELELSDANVDNNYLERADFLHRNFLGNMDELAGIYGN